MSEHTGRSDQRRADGDRRDGADDREGFYLKAQRIEVVEGVWIVSRHGVDAELRKMRRAVEGMPQHLREEIMEFFCDSKSGTHGVQLRSPGAAEPIASFLVPLRSAYLSFDYGRRRVLEISGWN